MNEITEVKPSRELVMSREAHTLPGKSQVAI